MHACRNYSEVTSRVHILYTHPIVLYTTAAGTHVKPFGIRLNQVFSNMFTP